MLSEHYQAQHDVLAITARLQSTLNGVTAAELHLLAYLSGLLALYRRIPLAEWGYGFVRSESGSPFSTDVDRAVQSLQSRRFLIRGVDATEAMRLSADGMAFARFLENRHEHAWRLAFLDGACGSTLAIPPGLIRDAFRQEPTLRSVSVHRGTRRLLEQNQLYALYEHFGALSEAVGLDVVDLMVPSVVWLTYLAEVQRRMDAEIAVEAGVALPADFDPEATNHSASADPEDADA